MRMSVSVSRRVSIIKKNDMSRTTRVERVSVRMLQSASMNCYDYF